MLSGSEVTNVVHLEDAAPGVLEEGQDQVLETGRPLGTAVALDAVELVVTSLVPACLLPSVTSRKAVRYYSRRTGRIANQVKYPIVINFSEVMSSVPPHQYVAIWVKNQNAVLTGTPSHGDRRHKDSMRMENIVIRVDNDKAKPESPALPPGPPPPSEDHSRAPPPHPGSRPPDLPPNENSNPSHTR